MSYPFLKIRDESEAIPRYYHMMNYKMRRGVTTVLSGGTGFKTGTGKSYGGLIIGEVTDKHFTMNEVNYMPSEVVETFERFRKEGRIGRYGMMDEAEITAASTQWQSITNRSMGYIFSTSRYIRCNYTMITPVFSWLDFRLRPLVDLWGYCVKSLDEDEKPVVDLYLYQIKTDLFGKEIYFKTLEFYHEGLGRIVALNPYRLELPSEDVVEAYEAKSQAFKDKFRNNLLPQLREAETLLIYGQGINYENIATEIEQDNRFQAEFDKAGKITPTTVTRVKNNLRNTRDTSLIAKILTDRYTQRKLALEKTEPAVIGNKFKPRKVVEGDTPL